MSNVQAAVKVADQLISKIFGHRQFTSGEINYLVREFGDKNSLDDNFNRILNLNQSICVLTDISNNDLLKTNDGIAKELSNQVGELVVRADSILKIGDTHRDKEEKNLACSRERREKTRQDCYKDISSKLEKLSETLMEEEMELERKYLKFEENLRNNK